jgi:hypothetical protein
MLSGLASQKKNSGAMRRAKEYPASDILRGPRSKFTLSLRVVPAVLGVYHQRAVQRVRGILSTTRESHNYFVGVGISNNSTGINAKQHLHVLIQELFFAS